MVNATRLERDLYDGPYTSPVGVVAKL
jgi:hypothetical protein